MFRTKTLLGSIEELWCSQRSERSCVPSPTTKIQVFFRDELRSHEGVIIASAVASRRAAPPPPPSCSIQYLFAAAAEVFQQPLLVALCYMLIE
jgi:hypothetical protein